MRSTTAVLIGPINYEPPEYDQITQEKSVPEKHAVRLEDISLVSTHNSTNNSQNGISVHGFRVITATKATPDSIELPKVRSLDRREVEPPRYKRVYSLSIY